MFNFTKVYSKINWRNKPDKTTPIDATNLGKIDTALNTVDDRVVELGAKTNSVDESISSINNSISAINLDLTNKCNALLWDTKSGESITIPAKTGTFVDIDCTKSGYELKFVSLKYSGDVGVVSCGVNNTKSTNARVYLYNTYTSQLTVTPLVNLLYVKL